MAESKRSIGEMSITGTNQENRQTLTQHVVFLYARSVLLDQKADELLENAAGSPYPIETRLKAVELYTYAALTRVNARIIVEMLPRRAARVSS